MYMLVRKQEISNKFKGSEILMMEIEIEMKI